MLPRLETRSQLLPYRTRGKEDSDHGGYGDSRIIPCGQGYNDAVIPHLFTPYSKLSFFIIQLPHNSFALTLSWDVRLLYYTGNYQQLQAYTSIRQYVQAQMDTRQGGRRERAGTHQCSDDVDQQ